MPVSSLSYRDYTIGWICVVQPELIAAKAMLDETHDDKLPAVDGDSNGYMFGTIGMHNVVVAYLPSGTPGTNSAAVVASHMSRSFKWLRFGLLVGIGGGVPQLTKDDPADIRLGDVVVSDPTYNASGVIQYDLGKTNEGEEWPLRTGMLNKPPVSIRTAVAGLRTKHKFNDSPLKDHFAGMIERYPFLAPEYTYQGEDNDILFEAGYKHEGEGKDCAKCLTKRSIARPYRQSSHPHIHYGTIASGNQVVKDTVTRDYWGVKEGVLCFEMEAAGLMDSFPCLVIRGICDYADSHKNMRWQPYAAAMAAAYAKDLLLEIAPLALHVVDPLSGEHPESDWVELSKTQSKYPSTEVIDLFVQVQLIRDTYHEADNVHWMVPKITNTLFTGREDILAKLGDSLAAQTQSLQMSEHQKRFVIVGDGGIGKSEVCLKFANEHRQHFWGIFWIDASSEEIARQSFVDIGKSCGAGAEDFERVKTWLANARHSWLLVLDNADNLEIDYAAFFPSGNNGSILMTTRNPQCRKHGTVGCEDLDHLDLQDAKSLLFEAAGICKSSREDNRKAAEEVVRVLGFHTLAIIQAGAYIKSRFCSLEEYPYHLRQQEKRLLKYHAKQALSRYGNVFATFEISATHLESSQRQDSVDALDLLQILGFIYFQDIPELMFSRAQEEANYIRDNLAKKTSHDRKFVGGEWLADGISRLSELQISRLPPCVTHESDMDSNLLPRRWRETLNLLESYSLVKVVGSGKELSFSMHPLAHTWARNRLELAARKEGWRAAGSIIALSMRGVNYDMFHDRLRSHVGAYLDHQVVEYMAGMEEIEMCQTHFQICCLTLNTVNIPKLRLLLDILATVKVWTRSRKSPRPAVQTLTARCLIHEGKPNEAEKLFESLVETDYSTSRPHSQAELAFCYISNKKYQKAVDLLEDIVERRKEKEAPESAYLLWSRYHLGQAYNENKQFKSAATVLEQVVEIRKETLVPAHPERLNAESQLALAYAMTNHPEKAATILKHVLEILPGTQDFNHNLYIDMQTRLAQAYCEMKGGHYQTSAKLFEQVLGIEEKRLAPEDPHRLQLQYNLAVVYARMGSDHMGSDHNEKAANILEKLVSIRQSTSALDNSQRLLKGVYKRMKAEQDQKSTPASEEAD